jgi:hypothetical protein
MLDMLVIFFKQRNGAQCHNVKYKCTSLPRITNQQDCSRRRSSGGYAGCSRSCHLTIRQT